MALHFRRCLTDEDRAKYVLYFIRNRADFHSGCSLADALMHILHAIHDSHIIMIEDDCGGMAGWGHYRYITDNPETESKEKIAFVESVMLEKAYRSSRQFLIGFRFLINQIADESPDVDTFQFYAREDHAYLNRLYGKFAQVIGKREGYFGSETLFSAKFACLREYLNG
ncbi:GNAT family N-acetyltransferase [Brevibacillus fluminis]|uniref:GNAT family N-acetyltransferase n=1 Tax=Brevibacillus fluminis TaxID=511487 RepID=UPI003F8BDCF6